MYMSKFFYSYLLPQPEQTNMQQLEHPAIGLGGNLVRDLRDLR